MTCGQTREYYVLRAANRLAHPYTWDEYFVTTDYQEAKDRFLEDWNAVWFDIELVKRTDTLLRYRHYISGPVVKQAEGAGDRRG